MSEEVQEAPEAPKTAEVISIFTRQALVDPVSDLEPTEEPPSKEVAELIRQLQAYNDAGQFEGSVTINFTRDGDNLFLRADSEVDPQRLIGALETLKAAVMHEILFQPHSMEDLD